MSRGHKRYAIPPAGLSLVPDEEPETLRPDPIPPDPAETFARVERIRATLHRWPPSAQEAFARLIEAGP